MRGGSLAGVFIGLSREWQILAANINHTENCSVSSLSLRYWRQHWCQVRSRYFLNTNVQPSGGSLDTLQFHSHHVLCGTRGVALIMLRLGGCHATTDFLYNPLSLKATITLLLLFGKILSSSFNKKKNQHVPTDAADTALHASRRTKSGPSRACNANTLPFV